MARRAFHYLTAIAIASATFALGAIAPANADEDAGYRRPLVRAPHPRIVHRIRTVHHVRTVVRTRCFDYRGRSFDCRGPIPRLVYSGCGQCGRIPTAVAHRYKYYVPVYRVGCGCAVALRPVYHHRHHYAGCGRCGYRVATWPYYWAYTAWQYRHRFAVRY